MAYQARSKFEWCSQNTGSPGDANRSVMVPYSPPGPQCPPGCSDAPSVVRSQRP